MANGADPANAGSTPSETIAPTITAPANPDWKNSSIAKIRWTTDEEATSVVKVANVGGPQTLAATFEDPQFKREHVLVVRGMNPGQTYSFSIEGKDPGQNPAAPVVITSTMQPHLFNSVHVKGVSLLKGVTPGGAVSVRVTITVVDENGVAAQGCAISGKTVEWLPGGSNTVTPFPSTLPATNASGKVSFTYAPANGFGSGANVEVIVTSVSDNASQRLHFHPLDKPFSNKTTL